MIKMHGKKFTITIPAELPFSPKVREFLTSFLKKESNFSAKWIGRLGLMLDEMVNNAIEHGSNGSEDTIEVYIISYDNNDIEINVKDLGKKGNSLSSKTLMDKINLNKKSTQLSTRGRGLSHIVSVWSDLFEYTNNEEGGLTGTIYKKNTPENSNTDIKKAVNNTIEIETIEF